MFNGSVFAAAKSSLASAIETAFKISAASLLSFGNPEDAISPLNAPLCPRS